MFLSALMLKSEDWTTTTDYSPNNLLERDLTIGVIQKHTTHNS